MYGRTLSGAIGVVAALLGVKNPQIQLILDKIVHRVLKGLGLQLFLIIDHNHGILVVVVVRETGHADDSLSVCLMLPKPV